MRPAKWSSTASWNKPVTLTDVRCLNSGVPPGNPENLLIFKPVSRATKAMKIGPKATQNHEKMTLESQEIQFLRKLIFAILSMPNACFSNPRHRNLDPKTNRKSNLEIDMKKSSFLVQKCPKSSQNGSPKSSKNRQNPSLDLTGSFLVPSNVPRSSQDRPSIVPGSSRTPK